MLEFQTRFGWCLLAVAVLFAAGLLPRFAPRFYPGAPSFGRRLAAPTLFGALAAACFAGIGCGAMIGTALLGTRQLVRARCRSPRRGSPVD